MNRTGSMWKKLNLLSGVLLLLLGAFPCVARSQPENAAAPPKVAPMRAPAVPLITHDPYFSIWSDADRLTDVNTRHWTGRDQQLTGLLRIDGRAYRWMGRDPADVPAIPQVGIKLTPTRTIYQFQSAKIDLEVTFLQPAVPDDLKVLSRPVTYLVWKAQSRDGQTHQVDLYLDVAATVAVDNPPERVIWSRFDRKTLSLLRVGTQRQPVLVRSGDDVRIDYGWFYLAAPKNESGLELRAGDRNGRGQFIADGTLPSDDDMDAPRAANSDRPPPPLMMVKLSFGSVGASPVERRVLLAYDEIFKVEYLERKLYPLWRKYYPNAGAMLDDAERNYGNVAKESAGFDHALEEDLIRNGGSKYAAIAVLAYQQTWAAHGLAENIRGAPYMFPKENFSNGSISTVDVIYPTAPFFLLLNPKLLEAQLTPVLDYAQLPRWKFPFAPHDLGKYPLANGQLYGGGESSEVDQMPVEESGNMILLCDALAHIEGNADYAAHYWPLLTKWAEYLAEKGMDPANQLSTDDFAGHLAHNANLSMKAIEALGAYAQLAKQLHHVGAAGKYNAMAKQMAAKWQTRAIEGDHYKLAFDQPGTWSQLYNLVWDKVLGLDLFPDSVRARAIAFYETRINAYGLPLDNRKDYTKLDWSVWTATMASSRPDFESFITPIYKFLNQTPDRVPMTDWYGTKTAKQIGFQARSVVGGVYMKMLADPATWKKWADKSLVQNPGRE
ncbi:MAG: DUF4965 domain-containing protein [Acidobacteriaceae bacterium]